MTVAGKFVAKVPPSTTKVDASGKGANPPIGPATAKETSAWNAVSPWVHGGLGLASFVPGLSLITGGLDAALYLAEGNPVEAGIAAVSMIPGGKVVTTAGRVVKGAVEIAQDAKAIGTAAKAARAADEAAKLAAAAKAAKAAEDAAQAVKAAQAAQEAKAAAQAVEAAKIGKQAAAPKAAASQAKKLAAARTRRRIRRSKRGSLVRAITCFKVAARGRTGEARIAKPRSRPATKKIHIICQRTRLVLWKGRWGRRFKWKLMIMGQLKATVTRALKVKRTVKESGNCSSVANGGKP
ncbi:hypothetical protein [Massilia sp. CCM 8734]|uniref:hypothetical protein n=1 Tax=Massilia sp. CCM 8734 TaxID=2609283 RepID=UPI001421DFC6|nr:hypothetical protein [Massilia sp. CCM 8734]NHZ97921.1 hypothetical protein [Massilia sp. CCM 8734]